MILLILKIIGIIILAILLLLILFIVLPLAYKFIVKFKDKVFSIKFNYLFFVFDAYIDFNDIKTLKYKAMIFNKVIADSSRKKESDEEEEDVESAEDTGFIKSKNLDKEINTDDEVFIDLFKRSKEYKEEIEEKEVSADIVNDKAAIKRKNIKESIDAFIDNFKAKLPRDMIDAAKLISHEAVNFFRFIKPNKVSLKLDVGFEDPYNTGIFLAFLAPMYTFYGKTMDVKPDFNHKKLNGELIAKGNPQIIVMLLPVIRLLLNKRFREIIFKKR